MLATLFQSKLRAVKFASRSFSATESRWPTTHQELFAVKWGLQQFCHNILGRKFKVVTDHANLKSLTSISPKQSKFSRWCLSVAEFDFTIEHRAGSEHVVPNTLSRAPLTTPSVVGDSLIITLPEVSSSRVQHGLSPSGNLINMHEIGKISSVGFSSQLLANTRRNWNSEYQKCKIQLKF